MVSYQKMDKKTLHLSLKKEWFDMIKSGEKKEEYREMTQYWKKRLTTIDENKNKINSLVMTGQSIPMKDFKSVHFTLGYPKRDDKEKNMEFEFKGIEIRYGKKEWGAEEGKIYFVIKLGEKIYG